ncbi:hypothetical protein FQN54_007070 [Arachnomyces sp. PD_36]|nr:hypothetical protein FQN54_007070 [Arachnomyces sp. PD_36]
MSESALPEPEIPTLSAPFYNVDGVRNLRDIGGYDIPNAPTGTTTRKNFIYRSARVSSITPAGSKTLVSDLGIKTIYDLRSASEVSKNGAPDIPGATVLATPVFQDGVDKSSPEKLALRYRLDAENESPAVAFARAYSHFLIDGADAFRTVFTHIRDQPTSPFLIHCAGGKDRTGVLAALMLRVAGVTDDEIIGKEYELTEVGMQGLREHSIQSLLKNPAFQNNRAGVEMMVTCKAASMIEFLKLVDGRYGSADGYLKEQLGFGEEDVEKIRANLRSG